MADVLVELVMQVHFLVVAQRPFSHGQACLADHRDFAVAVRAGWSMFLLFGSSKSCEAYSGCAGRAVYTGTRQGLTPAIRAEKGWRGRRELAPRCSATQLAARRHDPGQTRRVLNHLNHIIHPFSMCSICSYLCDIRLSTDMTSSLWLKVSSSQNM